MWLVAASFGLACTDDPGSSQSADAGGSGGSEFAGGGAMATGGTAGTAGSGGGGGAEPSGGTGVGGGCVTQPPPDCDDSDSDVYGFAVAGAERFCPGTVLACAEVGAVTAEQLRTDPFLSLLVPPGISVKSGFGRRRIAYRTTRDDGLPAVGSAMVYAPDAPAADADAPFVVINHGTAGLSDDCAPSKQDIPADAALILPWAAGGYPTIAVDYAGLGTEGVQGYGRPEDAALSAIDGGRALRALLDLDAQRPMLMSGHSQGGFTSLVSQALLADYAPELEASGFISFAGGSVGSETASVEVNPDIVAEVLLDFPITDAIGANRAIVAMIFYSDFARLFGVERAAEAFHPAVREKVASSIETNCVFQLAADLNTASAGYAPPATLGELVDEAFIRAAAACAASTDDASCSPDARAWLERASAPSPAPRADGAPILYVGGAEDTIHVPTIFACNVDALEAAAVPLESCFVDSADHLEIVGVGASAALAWGVGALFECGPPAPVPACPL